LLSNSIRTVKSAGGIGKGVNKVGIPFRSGRTRVSSRILRQGQAGGEGGESSLKGSDKNATAKRKVFRKKIPLVKRGESEEKTKENLRRSLSTNSKRKRYRCEG